MQGQGVRSPVQPAQEKAQPVHVFPEIFREHLNVVVQAFELRFHGLSEKIPQPRRQRAEADIGDFRLLQIFVEQHQIQLLRDMLGVNWVVGARN